MIQIDTMLSLWVLFDWHDMAVGSICPIRIAHDILWSSVGWTILWEFTVTTHCVARRPDRQSTRQRGHASCHCKQQIRGMEILYYFWWNGICSRFCVLAPSQELLIQDMTVTLKCIESQCLNHYQYLAYCQNFTGNSASTSAHLIVHCALLRKVSWWWSQRR